MLALLYIETLSHWKFETSQIWLDSNIWCCLFILNNEILSQKTEMKSLLKKCPMDILTVISLFKNKLKRIRPQIQPNWVTFQDLFVTRYTDNLGHTLSWILLSSLSLSFALILLVKLINVLKNRSKLWITNLFSKKANS